MLKKYILIELIHFKKININQSREKKRVAMIYGCGFTLMALLTQRELCGKQRKIFQYLEKISTEAMFN